jgi:hypothetical protein
VSGIRNVKELCEAEWNGQTRSTEWVKNVTQVTTAGIWYDLTGSAGNPRAKQWFDASPLTAQQVKQSTDGGIFHGSDVSAAGFRKFLRSLRVGCSSATPLPCTLIVCDYLLYYPTIEEGVTDEQPMVNTLTLPRYTTGAGVQMMAVTISSRTGGQSFTVNYTNSDGTAGRTSVAATENAVGAPGTIATASTATQSGGNPFITLQGTDTGVRSIEGVTMLGADTGFFALVLVKPLATIMIRGIDAVYDKDFMLMASELTEIQDDAYLSALALPNGSMSGTSIRGGLRAVWN